jgi:hypothetical protein
VLHFSSHVPALVGVLVFDYLVAPWTRKRLALSLQAALELFS